MRLVNFFGGSARSLIVALVTALIATSCSATPSITALSTAVNAGSNAPSAEITLPESEAQTEPVIAQPTWNDPPPETEALVSSPSPIREDRVDADGLASQNDALDIVYDLLPAELSADQIAVHEDACASSGQPLRWVGNTVEVTNVTVAGEPWASTLAAAAEEKSTYDSADDGRWNLCVALVAAPTELRPCRDDREAGGRGPIEVEGVRVVAFLDNASGRRLVTSSTVLFGACPYARESAELTELLGQIEASDGRLPSELSLSFVEIYVGELLDFAVAMDQVPAFDDVQCQVLAAALVARARFVVSANEMFGMDSFGNLGPRARIPSTAETRQLLEQHRTAGRVGERALHHFFAPKHQFLRAFRIDSDATLPISNIYSSYRPDKYTPHEAIARFAEDAAWRPNQTDPAETLRRGVELLEAGCTPEQIATVDVAGAPGMEPFDAASSDPSMTCGWLQATYAYRLEHRRALGRQDFETSDDLQVLFISLQDRNRDLFQVERFLGELDVYALQAVERSVRNLVDPDDPLPPNFEANAALSEAGLERMDEFVRSRCGAMPSFLFDVPTLRDVQAGGSASPDDLPALPESQGYRDACETWNDFYDARAALWSQLPTSPTATEPSAELLAARRLLDKHWLAKQSVMAMRPGFAQLIDHWNVMTEADRSLWLAATEAQAPAIEAGERNVAEEAVLAAVLHSCRGEDGFDANIAPTPLPPIAESG